MTKREAEKLADRIIRGKVPGWQRPAKVINRAHPGEYVVTAWTYPPAPGVPRERVIWAAEEVEEE